MGSDTVETKLTAQRQIGAFILGSRDTELYPLRRHPLLSGIRQDTGGLRGASAQHLSLIHIS